MTVGCRRIEIPDAVQNAKIPTAFLYPTEAHARPERFGPFTLEVAFDAAPAGDHLPLVVISHGTGSSPWLYRDLAAHLAREGFAAVLPEHPGNSRNDDRLAGTAANLENRPRHISLVIDAALADPILGESLAPDRVGLIGHSIGAYTSLAVAGARPIAYPHETSDGQPKLVPVTPDGRVKALVLLAPAAGWVLYPGALAGVRLPVMIRAGEKDKDLPLAIPDLLALGLPDRAKVDYAVVPGAGHFSFQSPFPPPMVRPDFPPSQDPAGFDRAAYQTILGAEVAAFLHGAL